MLRRYRTARGNGEEGSMIMALLVMVVATTAIVGTMVAVGSGLNLSRTDQNRTVAFQQANAGIDQAVYRLDQRDLPTTASGSYTPTLSGGSVTGWTETVTAGGERYTITATQSPAGQNTFWTVRSLGTDLGSGRQRQAIATVQATSLFSNGFFTDRTFYLTGNQDTPIAYDSALCPTGPPTASCLLPTPVPGSLGTNATFEGSSATTATFVSRWQSFNMYGRATQAAADMACDSGRCGTSPKVNAITNRLDLNPPAVPAGTTCPNGGNIGASGVTTTLPPGDYYCPNLNLQGTVVISGTGKARFWVDHAFSVAPGARINQYQATPRFQVFQLDRNGGGSVCDAEIWGLLYTPGLEVDCHGSHQPIFYGSVVAELHSGTGNHFDFHWDVAAQFAANDGKYVIKNWRECPVAVADC